MKSYKQLISEEEHKYTDAQLLRKGMREELEAIIKYEKFAEQATDHKVKTLFLDVAREEKVHAKEFTELLKGIDPEMEETHDQAKKEIKDLFGDTDK